MDQLNKALSSVKWPKLPKWHQIAVNARINAHIAKWWATNHIN